MWVVGSGSWLCKEKLCCGWLIVDRGWQFLVERGIAMLWVVDCGPWVMDLGYGITTFGRASPTFVVGGNLLAVSD